MTWLWNLGQPKLDKLARLVRNPEAELAWDMLGELTLPMHLYDIYEKLEVFGVCTVPAKDAVEFAQWASDASTSISGFGCPVFIEDCEL